MDIASQPRYPFMFVKADALTVFDDGFWELGGIRDFDAIHASPPCQAYVPLSNRWRGRGGKADDRPSLVGQTRTLLRGTGLPYVIENVVGAPLESPVRVCGISLGIGAHRHRLFETNFLVLVPPCSWAQKSAAVYGKLDGRRLFTRKDGSELRAATLEEARDALGIDWMDAEEIKEAVPPIYTEMVGIALMQHLKAVAA